MGLNLNQINQLKEIESSSGQSGLLANILNMFLDTVAENNKQLVELLTAQQMPEASQLAHSMKSSSRNVGADDLGELLQMIEDLGCGRKSSEGVSVDQLIHDLNEKTELARAELGELLVAN